MKKIFLYSFIAAIFLLSACGGDSKKEGGAASAATSVAVDAKPAVPEKPNKIVHYNANRIFRDDNDTHLSAAQGIGIRPLTSRDGIKNASRKLESIGGAMRFKEPYVVDKLTHSSPFLVPEAARLLREIGVAFQDSLRNKHMPLYSFIVTSVLRTDADVARLSKVNINASERSVHCYGTTFDITYARYAKHDDEGPDASEVNLKAVLTEVLRDFRNNGRCYVKYEVKQGCFHITARK